MIVRIGNECEYESKCNLYALSKSCSTYLGKRISLQKILLWDEVHISASVLNELLVFPPFLVMSFTLSGEKQTQFPFDKLVLFATTFRCKVVSVAKLPGGVEHAGLSSTDRQ